MIGSDAPAVDRPGVAASVGVDHADSTDTTPRGVPRGQARRAQSAITALYPRVLSAGDWVSRGISRPQQPIGEVGAGADGVEAVDTNLHTPELYRSLGLAVSVLRWMTIVTLFFLAALQPKVGRFGLPNWQLLILFAAYNLAAEMVLGRRPGRTALLWRVIVDLPAAGLVYFASSTPGSPQFDLLFLAVLCAAVSMPLRISLIYTAAAVAIT